MTEQRSGVLLLGAMHVRTSAHAHRLKGVCPDGGVCTLPVPCWDLCSRLESAEITAELLANARLAKTA